MYWNWKQPIIQDNTFHQNTGIVYANRIGMYPVKIKFISQEGVNSQKEKIRGRREISFTNLRSGGFIPTFYIGLFDKYDQIMKNISGGEIITQGFTFGQHQSKHPIHQHQDEPAYQSDQNFPALLNLADPQKWKNGVIKVENLKFIGKPNTVNFISISTTHINSKKPAVKQYLEQNTKNNLLAQIKVQFRKCEEGQAYLSSGECRSCEKDTYNIEPFVKPHQCHECPESAICYGGDKMGPQKGFWREDKKSLNFIPCLNFNACIGTFQQTQKFQYQGSCGIAYQGILCSECKPHHQINTKYECSKCPSIGQNVAILGASAILIIFGVILMITLTMKSSTQKKSTFSIYFKALLSHLQLLSLVLTFRLQWPTQVIKFAQSFTTVSETPQSLFSLDCLIQGSFPTNSQKFYLYLGVYFFFPIIGIIFALIFWKIKYRKRNQCQVAKRKIISSLLIYFFLIQPSVTIVMMESFHCFDINTVPHLYRAMSQICWRDDHLKFSLSFGLLGTVLWTIGIPLTALLMLFDSRKNLQRKQVKEQFGFLYNGYSQKSYYWEVLVMFRKVGVSFISVFLTAYGTMIQALILFVILMTFIFITIRVKPYEKNQLNILEIFSLVALIVTAYAGIFFLSSRNNNDHDFKLGRDFHLSQEMRWVFFVVIVLANSAFLIFWIWNIFVDIRHTLRAKYPRCYTVVCLCCSRNLYRIEVKTFKQMKENNVVMDQINKITEELQQFRQLYTQNTKFQSKRLFQEHLLSFGTNIRKLKKWKATQFISTTRNSMHILKNSDERLPVSVQTFFQQGKSQDDFESNLHYSFYQDQLNKNAKSKNEGRNQLRKMQTSLTSKGSQRRSLFRSNTKQPEQLLQSFHKTLNSNQLTNIQSQTVQKIKKKARNKAAIKGIQKIDECQRTPKENQKYKSSRKKYVSPEQDILEDNQQFQSEEIAEQLMDLNGSIQIEFSSKIQENTKAND